MRSARLAALAASSLLALSPTVAAAKNCWLPSEAQAAQVRGLHLMLMVGTMQCSKTNANSYPLLNNFVELQRNALMTNADILKEHFIRENGLDGWQGASDKFETSLANLYSGTLDDGGYCASVDSFVRLASGASRADLLLLAKSVADAPASGVCTPADYSFRRPAAASATVDGVRTHRLPPRVALSDALPALPIEAQAVVSQTAEPEAVAPMAAVLVVPTVAVPPATVPQAPPPQEPTPAVQLAKAEVVATPVLLVKGAAPAAAATKDEALNAAVLALQSAVAALQAVSGPAKPN